LKSAWQSTDATKDARHDITSTMAATASDAARQLDAIDDTHTALIHSVSRDVVDNKAQISALGYQLRDGFVTAAKDAEINALKTQIETAKQTTYLSDKIGAEGEKTRHLVNELKGHDLNRMLIERNALLTEAYADGRHYRDRADMGQYAAINSQLQALGSQFADARNSMVNFGTLSGSGQNSTSNTVR
jgi:hypothetical protein